ncbi:MAG: DUF1186 domain-containing protein, partial [Chlamydiia bacterium]|nr:DUF1186 domain-containing protein [Chlamydiia bacterium]
LSEATKRIYDIIEYDNYQGHLYAMYLLAQFREPKSYPLLIELISFPGEIPHAILGDVLTEDLSRILASVCDYNLEPIKKLIETPHLNEYVRGAAQTAIVILVGSSLLPRSYAIDYFGSLFNGKLERCPSFAWDNLISSCCDLYPDELLLEIHQVFKENLVDPTFISFEDVKAILNEKKESHLFRLHQTAELIDDTVTEMEKWLPSSPSILSD